MSAGNSYSAPSQSSASQGSQRQAQQQSSVNRQNLSRLPFTPNVHNYQRQDSAYERRNLGYTTRAGTETASRTVQNFDAQFYGSGSR